MSGQSASSLLLNVLASHRGFFVIPLTRARSTGNQHGNPSVSTTDKEARWFYGDRQANFLLFITPVRIRSGVNCRIPPLIAREIPTVMRPSKVSNALIRKPWDLWCVERNAAFQSLARKCPVFCRLICRLTGIFHSACLSRQREFESQRREERTSNFDATRFVLMRLFGSVSVKKIFHYMLHKTDAKLIF